MAYPSTTMLVIASLLLVLTLQGDYHLEKQTKLSGITGLNSIQITKDDTLTAFGSSPSVATFQGQNYQTKVNQFTLNSNQQIKVTPSGIFVLDQSGTRIANKTIVNNNKYFNANPKWFDLKVTQKYAIFVEDDVCPVLKQIVFEDMSLNTISYRNDPNTCQQGTTGCLQNIKNGQIILGEGRDIFILDNETLEVKQTLNYDGDQKIIYALNSYYNTTTKDVLFITNREEYNQGFSLNQTLNKYQPSVQFQGYSELTLISLTQAVSAYDDKLYWWSNLDKKQVVYTKKGEFQPLVSRDCALSSDQTQIACYFNQTVYFYSIDNQYNLTLNFNISIPQVNITRQLSFSYDNSHFYVLDDETHLLVDIDVNTKDYSFALDDQSNRAICWSFLVLKNYIVTAVYKQIANQTRCIIQLRFYDSLIIISSYASQIYADFEDVKLVGNDNWNGFFTLLVNFNSSLPQNNSILYHFTTNGVTIGQLIITLQYNINFDNTFACNQYLVSVGKQSGALIIADPSTMTVNATLFTFQQVEEISARNGYLIVESGDRQVNLYNFTKNSNWLQGSFIYPYYQYDYLPIIFTKNDVLGHYQLQDSSGYGPLTYIYNLTNLPLQKIEDLPFQPYTSVIRAKVGADNKACYEMFAYIDQLQLIQYDGCTNTIVDRTPVINQDIDLQLFLSDFGDYLIFIYSVDSHAFIDLRYTSDINKIYKTIPIALDDIYSADVTSDGHLILLHTDKVEIIELQVEAAIDTLDILSISVFDVNSNNIFVLAGTSKSSQTFSIVVKQFSNPNPINTIKVFNQPISIAISESAQLVAYCDPSNNIRVLNVTDKSTVITIRGTSAASIQFIGEDKLLLKFTDSIKVVDIVFNAQSTIIEEQKRKLAMPGIDPVDTVVSFDGTLIARIIDPLRVQIYNTQQVLQNTFIPPADQTIQSIAFKTDNTLLVATNLNTLYYLSPTACPDTYSNQNSVCLCLDGQYSDQDVQKCVDCSFACNKCDGSGLSCLEYSGIFYFLVIGVPIIVIIIIALIVWRVKKGKSGKSNIDHEQKSRESVHDNLV